MSERIELNLDELLGDVKPNYVTPDLAQVTSSPNKGKPRIIANLIIRGMANSIKDPIQKEVLHNGEIHTVRYVNVEPLCNGPWAIISLMMLSLSYGEQSTLIEAIYPPALQLHAKTFAVIFTPELQQNTITIQRDDEIVEKLDSANAGIAMIISLLKAGHIPHVDEIEKSEHDMTKLVRQMKERDAYKKGYKQSQDAAKHQDGLTR